MPGCLRGEDGLGGDGSHPPAIPLGNHIRWQPAAWNVDPAAAAAALSAWYAIHARDLPWRGTRDPWAILLSEVLLQQTRAEVGARAFPPLLARFRSPAAMAAASDEEVLRAWAGLGYYRRARSLHAAAKVLVERHGGAVPRDEEALAALPGLGPYTVAAVRAFAFDEPAAPLDANVARVVARLTAEEGSIEAPATRARLGAATLAIVREGSPRILGQALMEVGALVCLPQPRCQECPLATLCVARATGRERELPRKRPKAAPRAERWAFARVTRNGRVLLERRGPGLLEGFWALPGVRLRRGDLAPARLAERLREVGVEARVGTPEGRGTWTFTHRRWRFTVHPAKVDGGPRLAAGFRWAAPGDLATLPIAQPHRTHMTPAQRPKA